MRLWCNVREEDDTLPPYRLSARQSVTLGTTLSPRNTDVVARTEIGPSEAHVHITKPGREARLKLVAADHYPTLPVSRWTSAGPLARLVAEWTLREHPGGAVADRPLPDADFEFRGGELPS